MEINDIISIFKADDWYNKLDLILESLKKDKNAYEKLNILSKDEDPHLLHCLIEVAFDFDYSWALNHLSKLLFNNNEDIRADFCSKIGTYGTSKNEEMIINLLKTEEFGDVRCIAVMCLGEIGNPDSILILENISKNDKSVDYEGREIGDLCTLAIERIKNRFNLSK